MWSWPPLTSQLTRRFPASQEDSKLILKRQAESQCSTSAVGDFIRGCKQPIGRGALRIYCLTERDREASPQHICVCKLRIDLYQFSLETKWPVKPAT
jgi:hypothetical protein